MIQTFGIARWSKLSFISNMESIQRKLIISISPMTPRPRVDTGREVQCRIMIKMEKEEEEEEVVEEAVDVEEEMHE